MPTFDEELRDRIVRAVPTVPSDDGRLEAIVRRKRRHARARKVGTIATVAVLLIGTIGVFAALNGWSDQTPAPLTTPGTPQPPVGDLGLPYPVCRVSSMPITIGSGTGTADVFTKEADGGCPKEGDGFVGVGIDVTGDGVLDATWGPLPDCWFRCEAFAAPDINGDGVSEIAVSTTGADGFGVSLYAVTTSPPNVEPITVSSTFDTGPQDGKPLQFAWVDVVTHTSSAGCANTGDQGPFLALYSTERLTPAQVQTTSILIEGSTATVTAISNDTMPLGDAPMPGTEFCGTPIYGSAAGLGAYAASATCDVTTMTGDVDGDGTDDTLSIGTLAKDDLSCPPQGTRIMTIDLGADGTYDVRTGPDCSSWCVPFALADLNGDVTAEILLNEGHLAPPVSAEIGVYELREGMLQPVSFPDGKNRFPLQNSWQGYFGAYCTNPTSFWLWEGATDANGTLQSSSGTAYRLNVDALAFVQVVTSSGDGIPAEAGYDGRLCGADTQPLG